MNLHFKCHFSKFRVQRLKYPIMCKNSKSSAWFFRKIQIFLLWTPIFIQNISPLYQFLMEIPAVFIILAFVWYICYSIHLSIILIFKSPNNKTCPVLKNHLTIENYLMNEMLLSSFSACLFSFYFILKHFIITFKHYLNESRKNEHIKAQSINCYSKEIIKKVCRIEFTVGNADNKTLAVLRLVCLWCLIGCYEVGAVGVRWFFLFVFKVVFATLCRSCVFGFCTNSICILLRSSMSFYGETENSNCGKGRFHLICFINLGKPSHFGRRFVSKKQSRAVWCTGVLYLVRK